MLFLLVACLCSRACSSFLHIRLFVLSIIFELFAITLFIAPSSSLLVLYRFTSLCFNYFFIISIIAIISLFPLAFFLQFQLSPLAVQPLLSPIVAFSRKLYLAALKTRNRKTLNISKFDQFVRLFSNSFYYCLKTNCMWCREHHIRHLSLFLIFLVAIF